jgi:hypothetical protein
MTCTEAEMAGGGGYDSMSNEDLGKAQDKVNAATSAVGLPAWAREPVPGITTQSFDEQRSNDLSNYYRNETMRVAQELIPQDPQELRKNVTDAADRNNAPGRYADPEYDIKAKAGVDYTRLDWSTDNIKALASQRAQDYLADEMAKAAEQQREFGKAEQEYALGLRKQYEEKRLTDMAQGDQTARDAARQARIARLEKGGFKFKAGRSLLSLDDIKDAEAGSSTLLTK